MRKNSKQHSRHFNKMRSVFLFRYCATLGYQKKNQKRFNCKKCFLSGGGNIWSKKQVIIIARRLLVTSTHKKKFASFIKYYT